MIQNGYTIIIFTSDHGDGLPRYKRELFDTGRENSSPQQRELAALQAPHGVANFDWVKILRVARYDQVIACDAQDFDLVKMCFRETGF